MKKYFYLSFLTLVFLFLMSCNNKSGVVTGEGPINHIPLKESDQTTVIPNPEIFYGAYIDIVDSGLYELLMSSCRRCGLKRFYENPYGGTTYHRIYDIFNEDLIQKCDNWLNRGYIQIKFDGPGLPTKASVTIKPKSNKRDPIKRNEYIWGEAFTVSGTAHPINENKGFNIRLFPSDGLGGSFSLVIRSKSSNHVKKDKLYIDVTYGSNRDNENQILTADLVRLQGEAIRSQFTCDQYTN